MSFEMHSEFEIADITARYQLDSKSGRIGLILYPKAMKENICPRRTGLAGLPEIDAIPDGGNPPAIVVDPLVHLKIVGDPYCGAFAQGRTMRYGETVDRFKFSKQDVSHQGSRTTVLTTLRDQNDNRVEHELWWEAGDQAVHVLSRFINGSRAPVVLEMLSSFSLGGITPFDSADAEGKLRVHRFRSVWSAEARLETRSIEALHLERSWSGAGLFSERFGQIGSMPVRGWFPFVAVEDVAAGVTWGAQLAWAGSWQLEISRQHDDVCLSGGLADREFGHWTKTIAPGESLETPAAMISCAQGGLDEVCDRLTALQDRAVDTHPTVEHDLPIVFNEWCTTWGDPRHEKVVKIADRLKGTETKYLVIDAGWYKTDGGDWGNGHGDWNPNATLFPDGLEATARAIRERGLVPGLWFEMETVGDASAAFSLVDHLLQRDGVPVTVRHRRFWNLNDPVAIDYLTEKVIHTLRRGNFGYLKVDYNETIGLGADDPDGQGEGLRKQILGVYRFFEKIRKELPDLVIENCSSGGHRLEPSMLARTAMSSFSDAHELVEIPIIAANLHRLMLPRQSQIWAVLHPTDSLRRLSYLLTGTFLGRMCLSGDVVGLSAEQWKFVLEAQKLYRDIWPIVKKGVSRLHQGIGASWRHPRGWQGVVRTSTDGRRAMVVTHTFAQAPKDFSILLPAGRWRIAREFSSEQAGAAVSGNQLVVPAGQDFVGRVIVLDQPA